MRRRTNNVLLRYWGSHFKSLRQVDYWRKTLGPVVRNGWRCLLVLERPPEDASWLARIEDDGIEPVFVPRARRHFDLDCVKRVTALCRAVGADVIHCENIFCSPLIGASLARVPVRLWTEQNMQEWHAEMRAPTLRERISISTRVACRLATRVIAVSSATKAELVDLGIPSDRILVMHNPRPGMSVVPADRAAVRAELGYSPSDVVLVTVGNAIPRKALDLLLLSFSEIRRDVPQARLLHVGSTSGPLERSCFAALQAIVERERLGEVVKFAGHVTDVPRYLRAADLFVLPTHGEACSFALLEAMDAGLPCIATRVGAAEQAIADGVNGFLVERNTPPALTDRMRALAGDPVLRSRFASRARVPPAFPTDEELGEQLAALYESLLEGAGAPARRPVYAGPRGG